MRRFQNVLIDDEAGRLSRSISARPIGRVLLQVHIRCWMSERYGNALDSSSAPVISHLAKMKENKKPCGFSGGLLVAREGTRLLHPGGIKVFRLGGGGRGEGGGGTTQEQSMVSQHRKCESSSIASNCSTSEATICNNDDNSHNNGTGSVVTISITTRTGPTCELAGRCAAPV